MEETDYTVGEGQTATVCAVVEGNSSIIIILGLSTVPVTAEGQIILHGK